MTICKQCGSVIMCDTSSLYCISCGIRVEKNLEIKIPNVKIPTLNDCYWTFEDLKNYLQNGNKTAEEGAIKF